MTVFHQEIPKHHTLQATYLRFVTVINYIVFNNGIIFIAELLAIVLYSFIFR